MKITIITASVAAFLGATTLAAYAQTPTTTPQTPTTAPSANDASKSGSQTTAGSNTKPGAAGDSTVNNNGMMDKGGMKKDGMSK